MRTYYYTYRRDRGAKWAHFDAYRIEAGGLGERTRLVWVCAGKFQPAASRGVCAEVQEAADRAMGITGDIRAEVREIEPHMA